MFGFVGRIIQKLKSPMNHRQALLVKHLEPSLEVVMRDVIKAVNAVKGHALST